jgi:hexosaminidase
VGGFVQNEKTPIYWQEVFDLGLNVSDPNSIFHVWKDFESVEKIVSDGKRALVSYGWYFDQSTATWEAFYQNDICDKISRCELVMGGEACAWGEKVDDSNLLTTIFPRLLRYEV